MRGDVPAAERRPMGARAVTYLVDVAVPVVSGRLGAWGWSFFSSELRADKKSCEGGSWYLQY